MHSYSELIDGMMDAILTGDARAAHVLLRDKQNFPATAQLGVYIDGYRYRLLEALESAYPALLHYWGKPSFSALAMEFISAHPSHYFNLDKYAIAFAGYVADNSKDAAACDLARLEGAIHDVYQREETPPVDACWAQRQTPVTLAETKLLLRTASRLLVLATSVNDYLTSFRAGGNPGRPEPGQNWLLVLRHKNQVNRLPLAEGEHMLLFLLVEGLTLAQALEDQRFAPYVEQENFTALLTRWLSRWVSEGVLRNPS